MKTIYTLEELVNKYGDEKKINEFCKSKDSSKKSKGTLNKRTFESLIKTVEQRYGRVIVEGKGADRQIVCEGEFEMVQERKDNRKENGQGQIPYEDIVENMILLKLYENNVNDKRDAYTLKVFAHEIGMLSDVLYHSDRMKTGTQQIGYYRNLDEKYKVGHMMFWDIAQREARRIKDHLDSTLKKMAKAKIVFYRDTTMVVYKNESGFTSHEAIDAFSAYDIKSKQAELREKYNVTHKDLMFSQGKEHVRMYRDAERKYFDSIGIEYTYEAKVIGLIGTTKEVQKYMKDRIILDFKTSHAEHAKRLADKTQNDFYSKVKKIGHNKDVVKDFGGKEKPEHAVFVGTEFEYLMENPAQLAYDAVAQMKVAGIYPSEYEEKLKIIQDVE